MVRCRNRYSGLYWLPALTDETRYDGNSRTFHINLQIIVKNLSPSKLAIGLEIDGPTGTTTEGWWYQNKIHGRSTAVGYLAGARDVVAATDANSYVFFGGPEIVRNVQQKAFSRASHANESSPLAPCGMSWT